MATEFHGADLVVGFRSDPRDRGIDHYIIEYICASATVTHRVEFSDFQSTDGAGNRVFQDTLTFAENSGAGLTRTPTVILYSVAADGTKSAGDTEFAQNSLPVLPDPPSIGSTLDGVQVQLSVPSDADLAGYVAWVHTSSTVPMDDAHRRYVGKSSNFSIQLADDATYYLRVAPYDAFGLDLASAWSAIPIKRASLSVVIDPLLNPVSQVANAAKTAADLANHKIDDANSALNQSIAVAKKAGDDAQATIADANSDINQRITAAKTTADGATSTANTVNQQLNTPGTGIASRLSSTEVIVSQPGTGLVARTGTLETTLNAAGTGVTARLGTVEGVLTTPSTGLVARTGALETSINTPTSGIAARLTTTENTLSNPTTGIVSRTGNLETTINTPTTGVLARLNVVETATSTNNQSFAGKLTELETSLKTDKPSRIGEFDSTDDLKVFWNTTYANTTQPPTAQSVSVAWDNVSCLVNPGNTYCGLFSNVSYAVDTSRRYRLSCRVGAYMSSPSGQVPLAYLGVVCLGADGGYLDHGNYGSYRYSAVTGVRLPSNDIRTYDVVMTGEGNDSWLKFAPGTKLVKFVILLNEQSDSAYYTYVDYIRFADAEAESKADAANNALNAPTGVIARLTTNEQALSAPGTGLVSRTTALESSVNTPTTGISARLSTAENVLSNSSTGLVTRTATLEANAAPNAAARLGSVETAVTDGRFAAATRATNLEAQLAGTLGSNLLSRVVNVETATTDGRFASATRADTLEAAVFTGPNQLTSLSSRIQNTETAISDGRFAAASRASNLEAQLAGNAASNLLTRIQNSETAYTDGRFASATSLSNLSSKVNSVESTANTTYTAVTDGRFASSTSLSNLNSQINGAGGIAATVSTQASTLVDVNYRTRAYWSSTAVSSNNRAQVTIFADSNNGAGVDIVGDVGIHGNLVVDGTITSGKFGPSSVQQTVFYTLTSGATIPYG